MIFLKRYKKYTTELLYNTNDRFSIRINDFVYALFIHMYCENDSLIRQAINGVEYSKGIYCYKNKEPSIYISVDNIEPYQIKATIYEYTKCNYSECSSYDCHHYDRHQRRLEIVYYDKNNVRYEKHYLFDNRVF